MRKFMIGIAVLGLMLALGGSQVQAAEGSLGPGDEADGFILDGFASDYRSHTLVARANPSWNLDVEVEIVLIMRLADGDSSVECAKVLESEDDYYSGGAETAREDISTSDFPDYKCGYGRFEWLQWAELAIVVGRYSGSGSYTLEAWIED